MFRMVVNFRSQLASIGVVGHLLRNALTVCSLAIPCAYGVAIAPEEIARLKARIEVLEEKLARMEARTGGGEEDFEKIREQPIVGPSSFERKSPKRTPPVRLSADLRYRLDTIDGGAGSARHKHSVRARASAVTKLSDSIMAGFGLSTGGSANDSGNQTLGEGFSRKPVGLDLAYFDWALSKRVSLVGGKMTNPFFRPGGHHLLYDDDLRPEGLALSVDSGRFFGNASAFWAEERDADPDSLWLGIQAGHRGEPVYRIAYTVGASFHKIAHTQGRRPLFTPFGGQGNQLDADGNYLYGFSQAELFGELELDIASNSVTVFLDYVRNTAAEAYPDGFTVGMGYRHALARKRWHVSYLYQDLEANAVVGAFTLGLRGRHLRQPRTYPGGVFVP